MSRSEQEGPVVDKFKLIPSILSRGFVDVDSGKHLCIDCFYLRAKKKYGCSAEAGVTIFYYYSWGKWRESIVSVSSCFCNGAVPAATILLFT
jgi:hypothetical protein